MGVQDVERLAKIRTYAEAAAKYGSGTYADLLWVCERVEKAEAERDRLRAHIKAAHVYHHSGCHLGDGSQCDCGLADWQHDALREVE